MRAALQAALAKEDWPTMANIRTRLKDEDYYRKQGAIIRARLHTMSGDEEDLFAMASDSRQPPVAATRVRTAWPTSPDQPPSTILTDIEKEILNYF